MSPGTHLLFRAIEHCAEIISRSSVPEADRLRAVGLLINLAEAAIYLETDSGSRAQARETSARLADGIAGHIELISKSLSADDFKKLRLHHSILKLALEEILRLR